MSIYTVRDTSKIRKEIQTSRLLAYAKGKRKDGLFHVVAVYEMSNEEFFFFEYTAKTNRTPRRLWKLVNWRAVHDGRVWDPRGINKKVTLQTALTRSTNQLAAGEKFKIRYPHKAKQFHARVQTVTYIPKPEELPAPARGTWEYAASKSSGRNQNIGKHRRNAYSK
jgi:hypothetical protein